VETGVFKKSAVFSFRGLLAAVILPLAVIALVLPGLRRAEAYGKAEGLRLLKEGLQNAVVQCYVVEGSYPASLEYLQEHYGVAAQTPGYAVHYEVFAPNMPPDITVVALEGGRAG
jgi:hypothetical protein